MKKLLLSAAVLLALASCQKDWERDWLCTIEANCPDCVTPYTKVVVPFRGTYADMIRFAAARTWAADPNTGGGWQTTICR